MFYLKPYHEDRQVSQEDQVNRKRNHENHAEWAEAMSRHGFPRKKKKGRETINGPDLEEVPSESVVTWHLADRSQEKPGFDLPSMGS